MKVDEHEISAKLPGQNNDVDHIGFDVKDILFLMKMVIELDLSLKIHIF